jgi:sugar transferase EpsL
VSHQLQRLLAALGLIVLAPVFLAVVVAIRLKLGRPVTFRQVRPGANGEFFELLKFRTMTDATDADGHLLPDSDRITPLGRWLRATSLDELPELWNVARGEMNLVGPRPLLVEYLPLYSERQARRHEVRPGITGWSQVNGRNAPDWDTKLEQDVWYVDNRSTLLDLRILARTVLAVLRREGINHDGHVTTPLFQGTSTAATTVSPQR